MTETIDSSSNPAAPPSPSSLCPPEILQQLVTDGGSRIVLVVGAGTSVEAPTSLLTGAAYAEEAHRQLVADGVLAEGDCGDPTDLSVLADVVYEKSGGSQRDLTSRLPKDPWRTARPNDGHLIAAALLIEGAIRHVISLNYDLAIQNAFSHLGNAGNVSFIHGPEDHYKLGSHSVIYLHRSVDQDEETWVLRRSALENEWQDGWEDVVAAANLAGPVTVFVGLGSPAQVLTSSVERLASVAGSSFYLVEPNEQTRFAEALGDNLSGTVHLYWNAFMAELARRLVLEQAAHVRSAAEQLLLSQPELDPTNLEVVVSALEVANLLDFGRARARWLQEEYEYLGEGDLVRRRLIADLALGLGWAFRTLHAASIRFDREGRAIIEGDGFPELTIGMLHGQGMWTWAALSAKLKSKNDSLPPQHRTRTVLVAGMRSMEAFGINDLVREESPGDLIRGPDELVAVNLDDVRLRYQENPDQLRERLIW